MTRMIIEGSLGSALIRSVREMGGGVEGYAAFITHNDGGRKTLEVDLARDITRPDEAYKSVTDWQEETGQNVWSREEYDQHTVPNLEVFVVRMMQEVGFDNGTAEMLEKKSFIYLSRMEELVVEFFEAEGGRGVKNIRKEFDQESDNITDAKYLLEIWDKREALLLDSQTPIRINESY